MVVRSHEGREPVAYLHRPLWRIGVASRSGSTINAGDENPDPQQHGQFRLLSRNAGGRRRAVPAVVLASAVHGVDKDLRDLADEFASHGFIAAAPDLFWRTIPGPLTRADGELTTRRSQPRGEKIKTGEADLADTLDELRKLREFNGRAAVMGFCYSGPYA